MGTRIFRRSKPWRGSMRSISAPTGSGRAATWRTPSAMLAMRSGVNVRRSTMGAARPFDCAASRSSWFAARMLSVAFSRLSASARRKAFFCSAVKCRELEGGLACAGCDAFDECCNGIFVHGEGDVFLNVRGLDLAEDALPVSSESSLPSTCTTALPNEPIWAASGRGLSTSHREIQRPRGHRLRWCRGGSRRGPGRPFGCRQRGQRRSIRADFECGDVAVFGERCDHGRVVVFDAGECGGFLFVGENEVDVVFEDFEQDVPCCVPRLRRRRGQHLMVQPADFALSTTFRIRASLKR